MPNIHMKLLQEPGVSGTFPVFLFKVFLLWEIYGNIVTVSLSERCFFTYQFMCCNNSDICSNCCRIVTGSESIELLHHISYQQTEWILTI